METGRRRTTTTIPEEILSEILTRITLKSIARFKSVCKTWKSVIDSAYFRRLFVSLHRNSSSSWSLMFPDYYFRPIREPIGFYGCDTWDLPKSLGSYSFQPYPNQNHPTFFIDSSNGLIWNQEYFGSNLKFFVGNPVLQEWVEIPRPPGPCRRPAGLVTRVEEDGVVSSFKVVMTCRDKNRGMSEWRVYVYSSETGLWTFKRLPSSHSIYNPLLGPSMTINGMIYLYQRAFQTGTEPDALIAHDFYSHEEGDDQCCRVIPLPLPVPYNKFDRRCVTTSRGDVIYIETLDQRRLKVWRLNNNKKSENNSEWWQLSHEINMASVGFFAGCIPMTMSPFDSDIVYLWSQRHNCLVSGNLKTQEFIVHQENENWKDWSSNECCYRINKHFSMVDFARSWVIMSSQFVLPRWMDSVPRLPN